MRGSLRVPGALLLAVLAALPARSQELEPGAYSVSPVGVNLIVLSANVRRGDVTFAPTLPVEDARASIGATVASYVRSVELMGRSANVGVSFPFSSGHLEGRYLGKLTDVDRAGFNDPGFRFAVNLYGAPAMSLKEFASYRQKTNVGVSLVVLAPLGQYDPERLINLGTNRWSFKPEVGLSRALGRWTAEVYAGAWLFTDNTDFLDGNTRSQARILSTQVHVLYTFKPRLWAAFNANYYTGGRTTVNDDSNLDLQRNSRVGATLSVPLNARQSLKVAYSRGAYTTIGADFNALVVGWQYLWGAGL